MKDDIQALSKNMGTLKKMLFTLTTALLLGTPAVQAQVLSMYQRFDERFLAEASERLAHVAEGSGFRFDTTSTYFDRQIPTRETLKGDYHVMLLHYAISYSTESTYERLDGFCKVFFSINSDKVVYDIDTCTHPEAFPEEEKGYVKRIFFMNFVHKKYIVPSNVVSTGSLTF